MESTFISSCARRIQRALASVAVGLLALQPLLHPLSAQAETATSPLELVNGTPLGPRAAAYGEFHYFTLKVSEGATEAVFSIVGGSGDADIYVRYGATPSLSSWDYRPYMSDSNETVAVSAPRVGVWHVMVHAYSSYSGVTLRARHNGNSGPSLSAQAPVFSPAPGIYNGAVAVSLSSSTAGAVVRYTLDGREPNASSEVFTAPVRLTATTQLRAVAFAQGHRNSTVASGTYTIANAIRELSHNAPVNDLAGTRGSIANFRLAVPGGMSSVTFSITGSSGDADLYVKYGQLATTSVWDQRPFLDGSRETVTINTPRAGDYFVMVRGYTAYSGVTVLAKTNGTANLGKPDLRVNAATMNPRISIETFGSDACEIEEGTITAGTRKLLRFNTHSENVGTADLVLGNPSNNPLFEWGSCHGHYHFRSFAQYRLLDATGAMVRTGKKVGFCLMDIVRNRDSANPAARYTCSNQGIQAGWSDIYSSSLSGQWVDITGLPAGRYILEVTMDPMNLIDELDETNNVTRVNVTIP